MRIGLPARRHLRSGLRLLAVLAVLSGIASAAGATEVTQLRRSAIISLLPLPVDMYRALGVDFVAWGSRPDTEKMTPPAYRVKLQSMRALGVEVGSVLPMRNGARGYMQKHSAVEVDSAMCRTCSATPVLVPDLKTQTEGGRPIVWISPAASTYQTMQGKAVSDLLDSGVRSVVFDDVVGALAAHLWFGGCYSPADIAGLDAALRKRTGHPIGADLCAFHKRATTVGTEEFAATMDYYLSLMTNMLAGVAEQARLRGQPLAVSGNQQIYSALAGPLLHTLDFFTFECPQTLGTKAGPDVTNIISAKIGEALGKRTILTGTGRNHRYVAEHSAFALLRLWVAQAYAFGAYFVVPHGLWMDQKVAGVDWFRPDIGTFEPLIQFIRSNRPLFDDMTSVARVAVLLDYRVLARETPTDQNRRATQVFQATDSLLTEGIPFDIAPVTSDAEMQAFLSGPAKRYAQIVVQREVAAMVGGRLGEARVVTDATRLSAGLAVSTNQRPERYQLSLRGDDRGGRVLHVLNLDHDPSVDTMVPLRDMGVSIPKVYFSTVPTTARLYRLDGSGASTGQPATLPVVDQGTTISVKLGDVDSWSIVEF